MSRAVASIAAAVAGLLLLGAGAAFAPAGPVRVSGQSPFAGCSTPPAFGNTEVEPWLAADPRDPDRLVAVYQQDRFHGGGARGIVAALSEDGGRHWRHVALPVSRCAGADALPAPFASDPSAAVGPDGTIYAAALADGVSVVTSSDFGATWSKPVSVRGPGLTDKPIVTADPRRAGRAYLVWSDYRRTSPPGTESDELFATTSDGGRSWSAPKPVLRHARRAGPEDGQVLVDRRTGRLYLLLAWVRDALATPAEPAWMMVAHSTDGGRHWSRARRFGIGTPAPHTRGPVIRSSPQVPSFAVDGGGVLYAAWQDSRFSRAHEDVLVTRSADGGAHWSRPRRVGASPGGAIIPTIAAQGRGRVGVLYLALGHGSKPIGRYRLAVSGDGGRHFRDRPLSARFAITGAPELTPSPLVPGGYFLGDYMGIAALGKRGFGTVFVTATGRADDRTDAFYVAGR